MEQITTGLWWWRGSYDHLWLPVWQACLTVGWCVVALGAPAHRCYIEREDNLHIFASNPILMLIRPVSPFEMLRHVFNNTLGFLFSVFSGCDVPPHPRRKSCSQQCPKPSLSHLHLPGRGKKIKGCLDQLVPLEINRLEGLQ